MYSQSKININDETIPNIMLIIIKIVKLLFFNIFNHILYQLWYKTLF